MLTKKPKSSATHNDIEERTHSGLHSLFMMFMGALIAVMIGVFLYFSPLFAQKKDSSDIVQPPAQVELKPAVPQKQGEYEFYDILTKENTTPSIEGAITDPQKEQIDTDDVKIDTVVADKNKPKLDDTPVVKEDDNTPKLDDIEVQVQHDTYDEPSMQIARTNPNTTYILQIGSYYDSDEADNRRNEVMMAGVDARVVVKNTDSGELYQVISRTYPTKDSLTRAYERLKNNGIDSITVEQKR